MNSPDYPPEVWQRAQDIRLLILDVDGVLTDGRLYFDAKGEALKVFHVRDGHGIKLAQRAGIEVALLSGRRSDAAYHRARELGINRFHEGLRDKVAVMEEIMAAMGIQAAQVAMVGDDLVDLPIMSPGGPRGGGGRRRPGGAGRGPLGHLDSRRPRRRPRGLRSAAQGPGEVGGRPVEAVDGLPAGSLTIMC